MRRRSLVEGLFDAFDARGHARNAARCAAKCGFARKGGGNSNRDLERAEGESGFRNALLQLRIFHRAQVGQVIHLAAASLFQVTGGGCH